MSRGNIAIWFDPATQWYAPSKGKQGRNQTYSDAAIQCCLMIKSLFRLSLRMVTGFVQSLIKLCGLNWIAPDYTTLCRRQKHIDIVISYQKSSDGLHLLMDSTGMKFLGEGEWNRKKHGPEYRRQWRKLHIGIIEEIKYSLIAERLGYETAEIFLDWIQGKQEPTFTELRKIADFLGVNQDWLVHGYGHPTPHSFFEVIGNPEIDIPKLFLTTGKTDQEILLSEIKKFILYVVFQMKVNY